MERRQAIEIITKLKQDLIFALENKSCDVEYKMKFTTAKAWGLVSALNFATSDMNKWESVDISQKRAQRDLLNKEIKELEEGFYRDFGLDIPLERFSEEFINSLT